MDPSARIISHMNKDHHMAVVDYLVVYGNIPLADLDESSAKITSVDEKTLTITYDLKSAKNKTSVFVWNDLQEDSNVKVESMKDLKSKLVSMAKYAAAKQGYSHVRITSYPKFDQTTAFMSTLLAIMILGSYDLELLKRIFKNDPITSKILPFLPQAVYKVLEFAGDKVKIIAATTYLIHIFEISYFTIPRIIKYRVPFPQSLVWSVMHFIEGFPNIKKFSKLIDN